MTLNQRQNASLLAQQTQINNFCPQYSAKLAVTATSGSIIFPTVTGSLRQTFKITNKGNAGAYLAWGVGSATAVASSSTPTAMCDYIGAGEVLTQDFQISTGVVNTIAAIRDGADTTLEITIGAGQ